MRHPRIVIHETDGALASLLAPLAEPRATPAWLVRASGQVPTCLHELAAGGPAVLVLKFGRHLVRELTLIDAAHFAHSDVPIVAVGDAEDSALMNLALELGAAFVLQPPTPRHELVDVVRALMDASIRRLVIAPPEALDELPVVPESADESPA